MNSTMFSRACTATNVIVALFLFVVTAPSQISRVGATLDGIATDATGARIPSVEVRLRETETHQTRSAVADPEGFFRFNELPVGIYEVLVDHPGFASYRHTGVVLQLGITVHLDTLLQPASATAQVTVTAQPPGIDVTQTSVTSTMDKERIEELPVQSRNYLNFVLLAPGVSSSSQQHGGRSLSPLADSGFTFGGLRGRSNNVSIDGLDNNDEYLGSSRTELSLETIQEFQVVNSGLSAESGGASGGSISVVTRTGANAIHGDAFVFVQNGGLDARNPFESEPSKPNLQRYRTGMALGGPVIKDRTFYYAAFEQEHNRAQEDSFINPGVANAINRLLATGAFPRLSTRAVTSDFFPAAHAETEASVKVTHQLNQRNSLM